MSTDAAPKLTAAQAAERRQRENESAFRDGFMARRSLRSRGANPYDRPAIEIDAQSVRVDAGSKWERLMDDGERRAWVTNQMQRFEHMRHCWWEGFDTCGLAISAGKDVEAVPLYAPPTKAAKTQWKFAEHDALFTEDEVPSVKKKRDDVHAKLRRFQGLDQIHTTADEQ